MAPLWLMCVSVRIGLNLSQYTAHDRRDAGTIPLCQSREGDTGAETTHHDSNPSDPMGDEDLNSVCRT
jgi:hypothetical protein